MRRRNHIPIKRKLEIVSEIGGGLSLRKLAVKHGVTHKMICAWRDDKENLMEKLAKNSKAKTLHKGNSAHHPELEAEVFVWLRQMRKDGFPVSTMDIVCKALLIDPNFKNGSNSKLRSWARHFRRRHRLVFRRPTRVAQSRPEEAEKMRDEFAKDVMSQIHLRKTPPKYFINMDETAVYFNPRVHYTIDEMGAETVCVRQGKRATSRLTACVSVAHDGTKLPLFLIFKGAENGPIAKSLPDILPDGVFGCTQRKGWMDNRVMGIWYETVYRPYVENAPHAMLLLDRQENHVHINFTERAELEGTYISFIPGGHTSVCQPCDVGINWPLKSRLLDECNKWKVAQYAEQGGTGRMPSAKRKDVAHWLFKIWNEFPPHIIRNSWKKCGFDYDMEIDLGADTETDSDAE